jgi:radical SAM superfamily enzyme YgiQ (UPF0313 family)/GT2 family glycosyltransferase
MQLNDAYFEKYTQKEIDDFFEKHRELREIPNPDAEIMHRFGRLYEEFELFQWAMDAYRQTIEKAREKREKLKGYDALTAIYRRLGLFYSERRYLEKALQDNAYTHSFEQRLSILNNTIPTPTVTCYLPCYNQEKYIVSAIEGLQSQSYPIKEILVIDDGSTDQSIDLAKEFNVKIISHPSNLGLSAARNTAINNAAGDFIATVDTDVIPGHYWLEYIMLSLDDERVAGAGGRLVEQNTVTSVDRWRQILLKQDHGERMVENVLVYGNNGVFRISALKEIGGYDVNLRTNFEDMDLSNRLLGKGFKTRHVPQAICYHQRTDTLHSAVDTCYNWRKAFFERLGAFQVETKFIEKGQADIAQNKEDLLRFVKNENFDSLYPCILSGIRSLFKNIENYNHRNADSGPQTIKAAYIYLAHLLFRSKKVKTSLIKMLMADLSDIIIRVADMSVEQFSLFNETIWQTIQENEDINMILTRCDLIKDVHLNYLSLVFGNILEFCALNPIILDMLEASRKRIQYESTLSLYHQKNRIMVINPPWKVNGRRGVRAGSRWPFSGEECKGQGLPYAPYPFFMGYLAALLKDNGINPVVVDGIGEGLNNFEFMERVAGYQPDIIVMETSTASYIVDHLWLMRIKERLPDTVVIWTGPHVSAMGRTVMAANHLVDFIIQGEYEVVAAELIDCLINGKDYSHIKGLIYRNTENGLVDNGRSPAVDIDTLPFPDRLTMPMYKYVDLFGGIPYPSLQVHASRGCPFGCVYCVWPQVLYGDRRYRTRDPEKVAAEIHDVVSTYGYRSFYFDDDTFNIGKKRLLALCQALRRYGLDNIPWGAMARADTSDFETLKVMRQSGLVAMKIGVESGDQDLVERAGKQLSLEKVEKAVEWCRELGIKIHLTFTFGLPGETIQTIEKTIEFAKRLNPDTIQFSITTPLPGTKYFKELKSTGNLLSTDWERYDGGAFTVIRTDTLSQAQLEASVSKANCEFWENKKRLIEINGVEHQSCLAETV